VHTFSDECECCVRVDEMLIEGSCHMKVSAKGGVRGKGFGITNDGLQVLGVRDCIDFISLGWVDIRASCECVGFSP
jgi:hypothetical protein